MKKIKSFFSDSWITLLNAFCILFLMISSTGFSLSTPLEELSSLKNSSHKTQSFAFPMYFEKNEGQTDSSVEYLSRGSGYTFYFTPKDIVMVLQKPSTQKNTALKMQFVGAKENPIVKGLEKQECQSHYFIGNNPSNWRTGISNYAKVVYEEIYPGIDAVFYGNDRQFEYDICVSPKVNPQDVRLRIEGAKQLLLNQEGNLSILTEEGEEVYMQKPVIYQFIQGEKKFIHGEFNLLAQNEISFDVASYDETQSLIIDPILSFSTFLGGNGTDQGLAIAVDAMGNSYITGSTSSSNFPTLNPITNPDQSTNQSAGTNYSDAFVTKLNPSGTALIFSTYLGPTSDFPSVTVGNTIAIDAKGNVYIAGKTQSNGFPTTPNVYQPTFAGGDSDAFVTKLDPTGGRILYSTYLGGSDIDKVLAMKVDNRGFAYLAGNTQSSNFPITPEAYQTSYTASSGHYNVFMTKLNPRATELVYSTYLGGSGDDQAFAIAVDVNGNAYVTGRTTSTDFPVTSRAFQTTYGTGSNHCFITKLNSTGTALVYSTYLGGSDSDQAESIALDSQNNAYVTGQTSSSDFPYTPGAYQTTLQAASNAFVTSLNATGTALNYSTFLGGASTAQGFGIALDNAGYAYVVGEAGSGAFPVTLNAYQWIYGGGSYDAFILKLNPTGSDLVYSSFLGGSSTDIAQDVALNDTNQPIFTGYTSSSNFPTTTSAYQSDWPEGTSAVFVSKFSIGTPIVSNVFPSSATEGGGVFVTIIGANFTDATAVLFGTSSATFSVVSDTQITAILPAGVGIVDVRVETPFGTSAISFEDQFTYRPSPPSDLKGYRKGDANILEWKAPVCQASPIVAFRIYRDSSLEKLIGEVPNKKPLTFKDDDIKIWKSYKYYVVSVNALGIVSIPTKVKVGGYKKRCQ